MLWSFDFKLNTKPKASIFRIHGEFSKVPTEQDIENLRQEVIKQSPDAKDCFFFKKASEEETEQAMYDLGYSKNIFGQWKENNL